MQGSQEHYRKANIERYALVQTSIRGSGRGQPHGKASRRWTDLSVGVCSPKSVISFSQQRMKRDDDEKVGDILSEA